MAHDVFISYSAKDKQVADAACATLESSGVRCWIAPRDVLAGDQYAASLVNGLSNSRLMVLIFSANSNRSPQVLREVERAVSKGLPILPLRIEDAPMSQAMEYYISSQHWLDALTPPLERHLTRLCESVEALLSRQSAVENEIPQSKSLEATDAASSGSADAIAPDSSVNRPIDAPSVRRRWWIGAGVGLAVAIAIVGFISFKGRPGPQPAEPISSGSAPGTPVFMSVNNELLSAAASGDTAAATRLLGQGADVDAKNNQGDTPLLLAAKSGKIETAQLLIGKGANIEAKNDVGETALIAACTAGHADIASLLVEKGAATDAGDDGGATPLMYAGLGGNTAIIDLLLARGANINAQDDKGETPLMYAASAGSVDAVKLMLRRNANPATKDHNGQTALEYATQWKQTDVFKLLEHRSR
jgi:TIR domain/Ankyrin repeats (3 copies)/Ankyrin repeats (many copies)/Ankyrin repeat